MAVISVVKLCLSAIVPASFDLRDIILLSGTGQAPIGPWLVLYPPLYNQTASSFVQLEGWWLALPLTAGFSMQVTSLLFRLPIFALDLATAVALYFAGKTMASPIKGRLASLVWFANPYSVFAIELLGVPDILATFLMIVAVILLTSRKPLLSGMLLGLSVWVKFFPILLLPPILAFAHVYGVAWKQKIAILCLSLIGLFGYWLWIQQSSYSYLTSYTPVTQPLPFLGGLSGISGSGFLLVFFYCLAGLFAGRAKNLITVFLPTLLVYYAISNPAPAYLIWAAPLMALDIALVKRSRFWLFVVFYALAFAQWFFTSSAFLTPSGYSLLMIPLAENNPSWYVLAITTLLESYSVALLLPLVSSTFFACVVIYAVDVTRSWFSETTRERKQP